MSLSNPVEIGSHRLTIRQYPEDHPFLHMIEEDKKAQEPPSMMDLETCPVHTEPQHSVDEAFVYPQNSQQDTAQAARSQKVREENQLQRVQGRGSENDSKLEIFQSRGAKLSIANRDTNDRSTGKKESGVNPFASVCESAQEDASLDDDKIKELKLGDNGKSRNDEEGTFELTTHNTGKFGDSQEGEPIGSNDFGGVNFDNLFAQIGENEAKKDKGSNILNGFLKPEEPLPPKKEGLADDHQISFLEEILETPNYGLDFLDQRSSNGGQGGRQRTSAWSSVRQRREANPKGIRPQFQQATSPDKFSQIFARLDQIEREKQQLLEKLPLSLQREYTSGKLSSQYRILSSPDHNQKQMSSITPPKSPKSPVSTAANDFSDFMSTGFNLNALENKKEIESVFNGTLKNSTSNPDLRETQKTKIDLAFLFSSPLVMNLTTRSGEVKISPMPAIDYETEFSQIQESLEETGHAVRYRKLVATVQNFRMVMTEKPNALHFSGHGIENNERFFPDSDLKKQGNFLVFEHGKGDANFVSEQRLTKLIQASKIKLEFVFVASCYSEFAGEVFLKAGAKHVVCVRRGQQISDTAVSKFSKAFYHGIFSKNLTVCDAFNTARQTVLGEEEGQRGANQAHKFRLLINEEKDENQEEDYFGAKCGHQCRELPVPEKGDLQEVSKAQLVSKIKGKVDDFLGRSVEMHNLITFLHENRLVTIKGIPGIGKTSLAKQVGHFLQERLTFKNGVIYQSVRNLKGIESAISLIHCALFNRVDQPSQKLQMIKQFLSDKEVLLIIDNAEDLLQVDQEGFRTVIGELLTNCPKARCLLTSRRSLGAVAQITEKIMHIPQLSRTDTAVLLFRKSPRMIKEEEVTELLEAHIEQQLNFYKKGGKAPALLKNWEPARRLAQHPIIYLLGGHPQSISLAAPLLQDKTLLQLYEILNSSKFMDELHSGLGSQDNSLYSLKVALDLSLEYLKDKDPECIKLFYDLGLMPGGVSKQQLSQIWKFKDWQGYISSLVRASLLVKRIFTMNQNARWVLLPFMTRYAQSKLTKERAKATHHRILQYYANLCKKCFKQIGRKEKIAGEKELNKGSIDLMESETNIWALLNREVNINAREFANKMTFYEMYYEHVDSGAMSSHIRSVNYAQRVLENKMKPDCTTETQEGHSQNNEDDFQEIKEEEEEEERKSNTKTNSVDYGIYGMQDSNAEYNPSKESMVGSSAFANMQDHQNQEYKKKRLSSYYKSGKGQVVEVGGLKTFHKGNGTMYSERSGDEEISFQRGDSPIEKINLSEQFAFSPAIKHHEEVKFYNPRVDSISKSSLIMDRASRASKAKKQPERKSSSGLSQHQPQIYPNVEILSVFLDKRLLISTEAILTRSNSQQQHVRKKSFKMEADNMLDDKEEGETNEKHLKIRNESVDATLNSDRGRRKSHSVAGPGTNQQPRSKSLMLEKQSSSKSDYNEVRGSSSKRKKSNLQNDSRSRDDESTILQEEKNVPNELQTQISLSKQFTPVEITFTHTDSIKTNQIVLPTTYESGTAIQGTYEDKKEITPPKKMNFETAAKPQNGTTPRLRGDEQDVSYDKDSMLQEERSRRDTEVMYKSLQEDSIVNEKKKSLKKKKTDFLSALNSPSQRKRYMMGKQTRMKKQTFELLKKRKGRSASRTTDRMNKTALSIGLKQDLPRSQRSVSDSDDDFTFRTSSSHQKKDNISSATPLSTLPSGFPKKQTKLISEELYTHRHCSGKGHKSLAKKNTFHLRSESLSVHPPISIAQEFTYLGQLCVFYASCLALQDFSKDALSVIEIGLKVDEIICRANLLKLRGLIKMESEPKNFEEAKKDFHYACRQFQRGHSFHGAAICKAALGYLSLNKSSKDDQLKIAERQFEEALELYQKEQHYVGISYCYYNLSRIAKGIDKVKKDYESKLWRADRKTRKGAFIHRWQGRQLSLFIEVATSHREISQEINRPSKPHTLTTKPSKLKERSPGSKPLVVKTEQNELTKQFLKRYEARNSDRYDTQYNRTTRKNQRDKSLIERITNAGNQFSKAVMPNVKTLAQKGGQFYENIKSSFFNQTMQTPTRTLLTTNPVETEPAGQTTLSTHSSASHIKKKKTRGVSDSEIKFDSSSSLIDVTKQKARLNESSQNWQPVRLSKSKGKKGKQTELSSFNNEKKDQLSKFTEEFGKTFKKEASALASSLNSSMRSALDSKGLRQLSDAYREATSKGGIFDQLKRLGSDQPKDNKEKQKKLNKSIRNAKTKLHAVNAIKTAKIGGSEETSDSQHTEK